jgi:seryl-tRNA synthetase
MMDINFIRDNLELCKKAAVNKNRVVDWDSLLSSDVRRRELILAAETIRKERNVSGGNTDEARVKGKDLKEKLRVIEDELRLVETEFSSHLLTVPNVPDESVPVGKDSSGNVEVKKWGKVQSFDYPVKDHIELGKLLDVIDFERGTKVSGFRGYFLKNEGALLEMAVLMYSMQKLAAKGYTPIMSPTLVKEFTLFGNGQFPWGRDEVYSLDKDEVFLAGTAEVPVTAYYSDEVLEVKDLPKKFVAFSPCFRREAGSYGKDTKGVYRVHQFNKIEQVIVSINDLNTSITLHEELLRNSEEILQDLKIPYRVLLMCTGDMGEPQVKKYDIEAWIPSKNQYGEMMSNSFMGDFQARRLKLRYKGKDGKIQFCHTLNNTAAASPRILIPILENYQQKDGSVKVPNVLQPFVGTDRIRVRQNT